MRETNIINVILIGGWSDECVQMVHSNEDEELLELGYSLLPPASLELWTASSKVSRTIPSAYLG